MSNIYIIINKKISIKLNLIKFDIICEHCYNLGIRRVNT